MPNALDTHPFGRWPSPVSPSLLAGDKKLRDLSWDDASDTLVWLEGRGNLGVLMAQGTGAGAGPRELTAGVDVRGEVGYGGGDFTVNGGDAFFAERKTGRLWRQPLADGQPRAITPAFGKAASPTVSPDGRWVLYVHHDPESDRDRLAIVDRDGEIWPQILCAGADFYMQPRWGRHGENTFILFVAWDHPHMPWDASTLYRADVELDGDRTPVVGAPRAIAGGEGISVFQPEVSPAGDAAYVVADETGFWHLWRVDLLTGERRQLTHGDVEYGLPAWIQGMRTYGLTRDGRAIYAGRNREGFVQLVRVDVESGHCEEVAGLDSYSFLEQLAVSPRDDRIAVVASAARIPPRVVTLTPGEPGEILARASAEAVAVTALATSEPVSWQSGGDMVHGLYYRPHGASGPAGEAPPLIVFIHGGPTDQVRASWDPRSQFFATRGFAVLWPNYRGSVGHGRAYWEKLRGGWGVLDVEDAVTGARALAERGEVDPDRLVIAGGSAGGYTVLQALIHQPEVFAAGLCYYGVADMFALSQDTHKFEQYYTDSLVGSLPGAEALYRERSPVFHADRITRPVAVFQGEEDRVVPKAQSDAIVEALRRNGVPHCYHVYAEEGHGFRKPETLEHFFATMEAFLGEHVLDA